MIGKISEYHIQKPQNYYKIDSSVSRSACPSGGNFLWLKQNEITDVINFRTLRDTKANNNEENALRRLGIKYHQIPSITGKPTEENVFKFLNLTKQIKSQNGKIHIHCVQGANRTGMYSFIYKAMNDIGTIQENINEWIKSGLDIQKYPNLINWAINFVHQHKNLKDIA